MHTIISPALLADTAVNYEQQLQKVAGFARRVQIDLTDGVFATTKTIKPTEMWWPAGIQADIHMMYAQPLNALNDVLAHLPHMVIVHAEADGDFKSLVSACRHQDVKVGLALLEETSPAAIFGALPFIDHVMIFSGSLGRFGGTANLSQLEKVKQILHHRPTIEIGWDGGINDKNITRLVNGGVNVLNVGGYLQHATDANKAFDILNQKITKPSVPQKSA